MSQEIVVQNAKQMMFASSAQLNAMLPADQQGQVNGFIASALAAISKDPNLATAVSQTPHTLMTALNSAAQQGLQPGTEEYYLTPRKNKGKWEVLGITGYQGLVTRMYRSGAVESVVVEAVHEGEEFEWNPGTMDRPSHTNPNWFAKKGEVIGAYAYAVMKDGGVSKVVIVDADRIATAKDASAGSHSEYSPWNKHFKAMVLKTAAHDLAKWVPTSAVDKRLENSQAVIGAQAANAHAKALAPAPQEVTDPRLVADIEAENPTPSGTGELVSDAAQAEIIKRAKAKWQVPSEQALDAELANFFQVEGLTLGQLTVEQGNLILTELAK